MPDKLVPISGGDNSRRQRPALPPNRRHDEIEALGIPQQSSCLIQSEQTKALKAGVQHRDRRQYGQQIVHDKHRDGNPIQPLKKKRVGLLKA